jgi:hypothetical protein
MLVRTASHRAAATIAHGTVISARAYFFPVTQFPAATGRQNPDERVE